MKRVETFLFGEFLWIMNLLYPSKTRRHLPWRQHEIKWEGGGHHRGTRVENLGDGVLHGFPQKILVGYMVLWKIPREDPYFFVYYIFTNKFLWGCPVLYPLTPYLNPLSASMEGLLKTMEWNEKEEEWGSEGVNLTKFIRFWPCALQIPAWWIGCCINQY